MSPRRLVLLAAALAAAAGVASLLFFPHAASPPAARDAAPPRPVAAQAEAEAPTATAIAASRTTFSPVASPPASPATTAAPTTPTAASDDAGLDQPRLVTLGRRAADDYRRQAQYPPWSHPFAEAGEDPILRDRQVSPITAAGPDGEDPTLVVFPDQVSFEAPNPVLLYAYLTAHDTRVPAAAITGTITGEDLQPLAEVVYRDDGADGDRVADDLLYTARFAAGPDFAPELSESFLVRVAAQTADGGQRSAATGFLYSNPHARLTGNYRDAIVDGSLVIDAEVEVFRPGRFHLEGTLYSQDGRRGIAEAQTAGELAPGRQWMRLTFFGRILAESEIDGPYLLRFVALSTTTAMPNAKSRLVENAHLTGAYRFAQFSDAPFNDPDLLDAADRLEHDLAP